MLGQRGDDRNTVLVVEDEPDIAHFLSAFFKASGMDLVHVSPQTVAEVVDRIEQVDPSCVLLDLRLGPITGFEVLEAMGERGHLPELPVVVLSATDAETNRARVLALGATAFLSKPFSVREVYALVADLTGTPLPPPPPKVTHRPVPEPALDSLDDLFGTEDLTVRITMSLRRARTERVPLACALVWAEGSGDRLDALATTLAQGSREVDAWPTGALDELVVVAHDHDSARLAESLSAAVLDVGVAYGVALRAGVACSKEHSEAAGLLAAARSALTAAISRGPVATAR